MTSAIRTIRSGRSAIASARTPTAANNRKPRIGAVLWTIQGVLAALFLMAGGMKLLVPVAALAAQSHLPGPFMKFTGLCEFLGAVGLILPGVTKIRTGLTPLAAAGLVIIMIGATVVTVVQGPAAGAVVPAVVGALAAFVGYKRWERSPRPQPSVEKTVLDLAA